MVTRAPDRIDLHLDHLIDDADRLAPLLALGVQVEQAVQHGRVARAQLERLLVGDDGLLRVAQALAKQLGALDEEVELDLVVGGAVDHRLAGIERALVVALGHLHVERGLQRRPVAGVQLERLAQERRGLGHLVLPLLDLGEPEIDDRGDLVGPLLDAERQQVRVGGEGLGPVLGLEVQVGLAEQRAPVAGLELEGATKQLERAWALAEQTFDPGGAQAQLDVRLDGDRRAGGLAHQHLEDRRGGDVVAGLVVDLREDRADADVLGVELHHAREDLGGALDVAGLAVVDHAGLAAGLDALVVAGPADAERLEGLRQEHGVLAAAVDLGEQDQRGRVPRLQLQGAL